MARVSRPDFWEGLYASGGDGWDLGQPSPPLRDFVESTPPPRGRVAVPGCGRGHDARFLAGHGYDVVGFDFSPAAVTAARALAKRDRVAVTFEQRDIFTLGREYAHAFDGIWEYTCFCAIDPARRDAYVQTLAQILKPGGWLLACFFPHAPHHRRPAVPGLARRGAASLRPPFPLRARPVPSALGPRPPRPRVARARPPHLATPSRRRRSPDSKRRSPGTSQRPPCNWRRPPLSSPRSPASWQSSPDSLRRSPGVGPAASGSPRAAWPRARPHGEPSSPLLVPGSASEPTTIQLSAPRPPSGGWGARYRPG